jgi:hypothetical protein
LQNYQLLAWTASSLSWTRIVFSVNKNPIFLRSLDNLTHWILKITRR